MARAALCVVLCAVYCYWPVYMSSSGYLPWSFPPSLYHVLPRSSLAPLPPSSARFLHPLLPSLRPCLSSFPTRSLPQPFLHSRSHPPSHHRFLTPSPPPLLPSSSTLPLLHPPLAPSLPSSILPYLPASCRPIQFTPYACLASYTVLCSA